MSHYRRRHAGRRDDRLRPTNQPPQAFVEPWSNPLATFSRAAPFMSSRHFKFSSLSQGHSVAPASSAHPDPHPRAA